MATSFELEEYGSDLAVTVRGQTLSDCLDAALRGLASHVADVPAERTRRAVAVDLAGQPAALLVGVLDEAIAALDIDGVLTCGMGDARVDGDTVRGALDAVPLDGLTLRGAPPKAATWHSAHLDPVEGGWHGHVVLDL